MLARWRRKAWVSITPLSAMPYKDPAVDKARRELRRKEMREEIDKAKCQPCADCGVQFPAPAMQFDHIASRGKKRFNIARATAVASSIKTLREEIAKCEVVCANCHHIREHDRDKGQFNRLDSSYWSANQAGA